MLDKLRQEAALYRRLAGVSTDGGRDEDRALLAMANELEQEAARLEAQATQQGRRPKLHVTSKR